MTDVQVEEYGGNGNLSKYLKEFKLQPGHQGVTSLGITRDADASVVQTFQRVTGLLAVISLTVPSQAGQITSGSPNVGVFLMPDNQREGMLENLCWDAVQADGAVACVIDYFDCVARQTKRQPRNIAKARIHAWLASQLDPELRLGEAAGRNYFPWTAGAFQPLVKFIQHL